MHQYNKAIEKMINYNGVTKDKDVRDLKMLGI